MPDTRSHRGPDSQDAHLFGASSLPALGRATDDLCWLLERGYAARSALDLVGNRYSLAARQRSAVARCACAPAVALARTARQITVEQVRDQEVWIDGLNVLTGLEVALSGGVILIGRDRCFRDVAGVHRQYRKVEETVPALQLVGELTAVWGVRKCCWWLDKPVSNSGRVRSLILDLAGRHGWDWEATLVYSPDTVLANAGELVASSDSVILDRCRRWVNLVGSLVGERIPQAWIVDLSTASAA